ncbi:oligosaccharide flippase family protein [Planococcus maritimus]|uniref:Oligosaccharide flippase family protein n=1 Tax=Planococcus maritimus TaxID=192421 RepID=A0A7D7M9E4_PLAMR|nr:oligosaccharide flippase family protein [Planococcus maritimus]QMT16757.1 oligosaccharide flippase family protein [Planococcus maritimus]
MFNNILKLLTGTMISQIINIAASPILSRLFSPAEFGISTMFQSITSIMLIVCTLKLDSAVMIPKSEILAKRLLKSSLFYTSIFSLGTILTLSVLSILNISILGFENTLFIVLLLSLMVLFTGTNSSYTNWANRQRDYKIMMWVPIVNTGTATLINVLLGYLDFKTYGLIIGIVSGQFITASILLFLYKIPDVDTKLKYTTKKYSQFPLYQMPSLLLNTISVQVAIFAFYFFYNDTITGWYSMAQRILLMPLTILGSAIAQIYYKEAVALFHHDKSLKKLTERIVYSSYLVIFLPMYIIMCFGESLFSSFFGEDWGEAGEISAYLAPWFLMVFVGSPLSILFMVLGKQKINFLFNTIMLVSRLTVIWLGSLFFQDYLQTVALFGITGFGLWFFISIYLMKSVGVNPYKYSAYSVIYFLILFLSVIFTKSITS